MLKQRYDMKYIQTYQCYHYLQIYWWSVMYLAERSKKCCQMIYGNKGDTFVCREERNNNNSKRLRIYESHMKPAPSWLVSSVGRALHRYRRGHGFKSRTGLNFFRPYFHYCPSSANYCEDHFYSRHSKIITVLINLTQVSIHFSYMSR